MNTRALLAAVLLFTSRAAVVADPSTLDPEISSPYRWQVLLHTKPHPLLGSTVREDLRREILAALQPVLGSLGTVDMLDLATVPREGWPILAKEYESRGWAAFDMSPLRELEPLKTSLLHIEVRGSEFFIESRQLDGFTGLPLPTARRTTRSAELVGRLAGLMLEHDFGVDGTIDPLAGPDKSVMVNIRGSKLAPMDRYLKRDDVLAIAGIRKSIRPAAVVQRTATGKVKDPIKEQPPAFTAVPREFTLLKVAEITPKGQVRCKVVTGYADALPLRGLLGYRCVKLPTVIAPLTIRLVGRGGIPQKSTAATLRANDIGTEIPGDELEQQDNLFRSKKPLGPIAYLTLNAGATKTTNVPVPVLGPDPILIPFNLDPVDEKRILFERDCIDLARRMTEARQTQNGSFAALKTLMESPKPRETLERARAAVVLTEADEKELSAALTRLRESASLSPAMATTLVTCERQLSDLKASHAELVARTADIETMVKRSDDPANAAVEVQATSLNSRIRLLLERGDVDEALTVYDQLVTLLPGNSEVAARRDRLREEWKIKSDTHGKAREYLTRSWPTLATIPDLKESMKTFESSVDELLKQKDSYTCRKLLGSIAIIYVRIHDLTQKLDRANDLERAQLNDAEKLIETISSLEGKIRETFK